MKKIIMFTLAFMTWLGYASAEEFTVADVSIPKGGTAILEVNLNNPSTPCVGYQFVLSLPQGVSIAKRENETFIFNEGTRMSDLGFTTQIRLNEDSYNVLSYNANVIPMTGTTGAVIQISLKADESVAVGQKLNASIQTCKITNAENESMLLNDEISFQIMVDENRTLLDENSTTAPEASEGSVDVRVKRTITAGNWSSICLPFAMTNAQMKEVFGNDVQLANFTGYEAEEDGDGNIVGITVNFANATAIEANHPYIIKVSEAITEFTVDGVDVEPEDEPVVATVKRTRKQWSEMIGTYVADTEIPSKTLFLNSNKFYYSTGATKMKAFRAYFDFFDVLTDVDNSYEVKMFVDGAETKVEGLGVKDAAGNVYDLSGRKVSKAGKGVYIVNGKKVLVN